jgi:hypothetical protein
VGLAGSGSGKGVAVPLGLGEGEGVGLRVGVGVACEPYLRAATFAAGFDDTSNQLKTINAANTIMSIRVMSISFCISMAVMSRSRTPFVRFACIAIRNLR